VAGRGLGGGGLPLSDSWLGTTEDGDSILSDGRTRSPP
jgi:hypothetical protein